jgi:hypothetical protein
VNAGGGLTINLGGGDYPTKCYMEARYHYSLQGGRVPTKVVPVTFGFRCWNQRAVCYRCVEQPTALQTALLTPFPQLKAYLFTKMFEREAHLGA